nr:translocation/assembly module TamB domain-containing protein [Bacteroidota bacterium]
LPGSDEGTKTQLKTLLNNEQELNQQVFALLTLNRFVPTLYAGGNNQGAVTSSGTNIFSNSTEMLSNQLSNWLSQISKDFDIGVNYRPGVDQITSQEVEVMLSTQLLNDRVVIDGNFGLPINQQNQVMQNHNQNLVGDFNMEYKVSQDGRFRIRAFNRFNNYLLNTVNTPYTQGVGLFYRVEFNSFNELANRYINKFKRREKDSEQIEKEKELKKKSEDDDSDFDEKEVTKSKEVNKSIEEIWQGE